MEAGGSLKEVVKLTVYVTEISYRGPVNEAINRWFEGVHHCSTGVVVSALADPALLVEIDAMAVSDDEQKHPRHFRRIVLQHSEPHLWPGASMFAILTSILLIIALGNVLRGGGIPSKMFWNLNDKLVYWMLMPCLMFNKKGLC